MLLYKLYGIDSNNSLISEVLNTYLYSVIYLLGHFRMLTTPMV